MLAPAVPRSLLPESHGWLGGFFYFFLRYGAWGLVLLSALDSSFLALPFANDIAVIVLSSLHHNLLVEYALGATIGSVIGSYAMYWLGHKGGEAFLQSHISPRRYKKLHDRVSRHGPELLAVPAILPPPFPYTAWVIAAGALEVPRGRFMLAIGAMRALRFFAEAILAVIFGRGVVAWLQTDSFRIVVEVIMAIAVLASAYSVYTLVRSSRGAGRGDRSGRRQSERGGRRRGDKPENGSEPRSAA